MENASRATIIAGGMLIAILVVSLLVWGWSRLSKYQSSTLSESQTEEITRFNKQFESYNKKVIRGYELISLCNLIESTNARNDVSDGYTLISAVIVFNVNIDTTPTYLANPSNNLNKELNLLDYKKAIDAAGSDALKAFKELYFECTDIQYVEDSRSASLGRVKYFKFIQIQKK